MWGLSGIISGRLVERRKFQFVFPSEELLQSVLNRGPWAFNDRMVVIKRWMPEMDDNDLMQIPFWVQIRGIPMEYLTEGVIRNIGDIMGEAMLVDFNPEANAAVEYVRVQLNWNLAQPLRFQKNFQFSLGVNTLLKFRYERLRGFCETCGMITHDSGECIPHGEDLQNDSEPDDEDNEGGGMDDGEAEPVLDGNVNMEHAANVADQAPPGGSPQQDGVALEEYSGRNDPTVERRGRRNKFSGNLLLEGEMVTGEYDEDLIDDSDQGAVDGEEKWRGDRSLSQYGTTVETGETSRPQVGKRKRSKALVYNRKHGVLTACGSKKMRAGVVIVDKFDVEDYGANSAADALNKIQRDYGEESDQELVPSIDRGAVGPVPPKVP
ncbi:uncharacterized protein LOC103828420 [Brassica rapa]|uniref:uncharacterized protein LOC103828420 n=1 Tax=Brassica campestris TaxID=3711 RepID=UPI0004F1C079|nr:uncharacterized protein LOC103828420 [Brassica rapa]XP_048593289.1 uncharacterized protein LOC125576716 [Brassica napus]